MPSAYAAGFGIFYEPVTAKEFLAVVQRINVVP